MKKIWLIDAPFYQYNENIKELAKQNNLTIIDSSFKDSFTSEQIATDTPELTIKGQEVVTPRRRKAER